ncbi:MAG: TetR/AcrR family transcriptional regulator, transcriptional repressor for nem operon [Mycobacterium sp.]|jgi:TetR/AcrR family transcriptional repressor of nem operon|nr:TetR/AcrR family transcriptional regulator, transcriptional repressor for nem operon [Mycobacterium sp.]
MRVTRKQAEINRQRIIDSAIKLFAERGVDGVGVAEVMGDAGFTHGGFYNHFTSKDDLVLHACSTSFARSLALLRSGERLELTEDSDFGACLSAALLSESSKGDTHLTALYAKGLSELLDVLSDQYGDRDRAAGVLARVVGARVMSRAVDRADPELSEQLRAAVSMNGDQLQVHCNS